MLRKKSFPPSSSTEERLASSTRRKQRFSKEAAVFDRSAQSKRASMNWRSNECSRLTCVGEVRVAILASLGLT